MPSRMITVLGRGALRRDALLEFWKGAYAWWREHKPGSRTVPADRNRSRYDLPKMFTGVREEDSRWSALDTRVGRGVNLPFRPGLPSPFYKRCAKEGTKRPVGRWWRLAVKGVPAARFCDRNGRLVSAPLNPVGIEKGLSRRMALSDGRYVYRLGPCTM